MSDRDRVRNALVKEATYAAALAGFVSHAFNHGHGVRITIQVDGEKCGVAILAHAKEPLIEYLAHWSCAQKLVKQDRLDEFDKGEGGEELVSGPVDNPHAINYRPRSKKEGDFNAEGGA